MSLLKTYQKTRIEEISEGFTTIELLTALFMNYYNIEYDKANEIISREQFIETLFDNIKL